MSRTATSILLILLVVLGVFVAWYWLPRSEPHPMNPAVFTAHYRGFAFDGGTGIFGKRWYAVTYAPPREGGRWQFEFRREGYSPFKGYYPDGTLREEGECLVELMGAHHQPFPDPNDVKWSKCYRPDGSLGSEVVDGTGTQTLWMPDGVKIGELQLRDYQRVKMTTWYPNGELQMIIPYVDGKRDGPYVAYDAQGRKESQGAYRADERVGKWTQYHPDGSVKSIETYGNRHNNSDN